MRTLTTVILAISCQYAVAQKLCGTASYLENLRKELASSLAVPHGLSAQSSTGGAAPVELNSQSVITIPVVVHVLYNNASNNVSDARIQSQIDALNENFNRANADFSKVPAVFAKVAGVANIRFTLAKVDPQGRATTGITRTRSPREMWSNDDKMKMPAFGGVAPWDRNSYLNIWVCNLVPGLLGYASAPSGPADRDGVVIKWDIFGTVGTSGNFNLGRTAVHEVGHWLNLKHLWGDQECGSDEVDDTPQQRTYNLGTPSFPRIGTGCSSGNPHGDMFMNFMDFTNDASMMMFTQGQVTRMRALFAPGGVRNALLVSKALGEPWNNTPSTASNISTPVATTPSAVNAAAAITLKLYPNPATDRITISAQQESQISGRQYSIYSADGRAVSTGQINGNAFQINVSSLQRGLYFIRIAGGSEVLKFMKQ